MLPVATPSPSHHNHAHRRHHQYQHQQRSPTPTARSTVEDYVRLALEKRDIVVTVESTLAGQPTQYSSPKKAIPIGPIVGGVVAGVLIVLLAGGFWWWWVANKPRVVAQREAQVIPKTPAGRVPPPISKRDSSRSSASTSKPPLGSPPLSEKQSYPLGPVSTPSSRSRPLSTNNKPPVQPRSVSAESQLHLLPTLSSDASSSSSHDAGDRNTSPPPVVSSTRLSVPANKYVPAKPSPLAAGAATPSAAPRWGEIPFQSHITPPPAASSTTAPSASFTPLPPPITNSFSLAAPLSTTNDNRVSQSSIQSAQSNYSQGNSPFNQERFSSQTTGAFEYDDPDRTTYYGGDEEEKRRSGGAGGQRGDGRQSYGYLVSTAPSSARPSNQNGNGPVRTSQRYSQQPLPQPNRYSQPPPQAQQQPPNRLSQQAWDQGGYGPRYDYESGYPSEELDGYYGSAAGGGEGGRS